MMIITWFGYLVGSQTARHTVVMYQVRQSTLTTVFSSCPHAVPDIELSTSASSDRLSPALPPLMGYKCQIQGERLTMDLFTLYLATIQW